MKRLCPLLNLLYSHEGCYARNLAMTQARALGRTMVRVHGSTLNEEQIDSVLSVLIDSAEQGLRTTQSPDEIDEYIRIKNKARRIKNLY